MESADDSMGRSRALLVLVHGSAVSVREKRPLNSTAAVLADFKNRVDKYVAVRNKADDSAPPQKKTAGRSIRARCRGSATPITRSCEPHNSAVGKLVSW